MYKLWLDHYQTGVAHEIDIDVYPSLLALFSEICALYPDNIAYMNLKSSLSYKQLDIYSLKFARYLQQLGLKKGARVAIMLPNLLQYPIVFFAILRAGYVVVNTNPLYTSDELIHQLNDAGAEAIIVLANFASTVEKSLANLPLLQHIIISEIGDIFAPLKRIIVNFVVKYIKKMVTPYKLPQALSFKHALLSGEQGVLQDYKLCHQDIALLQYTGGTTGTAKGAILTHANLIANILQARAWLAPLSLDSKDIIITALPLYHIFSLTANLLTFFSVGAKNILITNPRDISTFIKQIKNSKFTAITGVNTLYNTLLNHPKFKQINFSSLKLALSGGMALQKNIAIKWQEKTASRLLEAYGLTETSPAVTINPMYVDHYNGSIGLPLPSTDISIRNEQGQECALGESGELCIKGPQVSCGYWQRPDETAQAFWPDGFFRSGDIAKIDQKGFVYLVDRKKDMIIVSGFNVYPNEVEQVIGMLDGVREVGVIGVNAGDYGERIKACIVKSDPNLSAEQIIAHARAHLSAYKVPKIIEFYDELPKTNIGKILRRALR